MKSLRMAGLQERDFKPEPPVYKAGMLTNQLHRKILISSITMCRMSMFVVDLTVTGLIRAYVFAGSSHTALNRLVLSMETKCIFCAVLTECLNIQMNFKLQRVKSIRKRAASLRVVSALPLFGNESNFV
jgi:hypothetical protein